MGKHKFITEFEINASKKMLYPYLYSASGLSQWFADDVNIDEDKNYVFFWDGENHKAKIATHKSNSFVKFEMMDDTLLEDGDEASYFEFKLEMSDLTQSVFLRITDYSENSDEEELQDLWESLIISLKEIVGG